MKFLVLGLYPSGLLRYCSVLKVSLLYSLLFLVNQSAIYVKPCAQSHQVSHLAIGNVWSHTCESSCLTLQLMAALIMQILVEIQQSNSNPTLWYSRNLHIVR